MAAHPEAPSHEETTASPLDRHAPPVADQTTASGKTRDGRAVAAMIVGILGIPLSIIPILGLILGVVALVLGILSRKDIRRSGRAGGGQAMAGIICGSIAILLSLAIWAANVAVFMSNN